MARALFCRAFEQCDPAEFRDVDALAQPSSCFAPVGRVVRERLCRAHRQPDHADPARNGRGDLSAIRRDHLCDCLSDRRGHPAEFRRPAAFAADVVVV